ncbi:hypothetical protein HOD61_00765 [archaeon]|mgnify:CR=1 FL=1|jgi:hypothetical protein|nr:hypothetical protein [archaeon]
MSEDIFELGLNLETIKDVVDQYDVKFSHIGVKGRINYDDMSISLSPLFNDCNTTLLHEIVHHQIDNVLYLDDRFSESDIDAIAAELLEKNEEIYDYLTEVIEQAPLEERLRIKQYT